MAARPTKEIELAQHNYRKFTAQQKLEIVLAGLRSDRSVRDVCCEHEIAETLSYSWRDRLLESWRSPARTSAKGAPEEDPRARPRSWAQDLRARDRGGSIAGLGGAPRGAAGSGGVRDPAEGPSQRSRKQRAAETRAAGDGESSPDEVATSRNCRTGRARRARRSAQRKRTSGRSPFSTQATPTRWMRVARRRAGIPSPKGLPFPDWSGKRVGDCATDAPGPQGQSWAHSRQPTGSERGTPSVAASPLSGQAGSSVGRRRRTGRCLRSSPRLGEPARWRRKAAGLQRPTGRRGGRR